MTGTQSRQLAREVGVAESHRSQNSIWSRWAVRGTLVRTRRRWSTVGSAALLGSLLILWGSCTIVLDSNRPAPIAPDFGMAASSTIPTIASVFAGYFVLNTNHGSVTAVRETYVQPTASCILQENSTGGYPNGQNAWVGPGLYNGNVATTNFAFFQMGTEALCQPFHHVAVYLPFYYTLALRPSDPPFVDNVMHPIAGVSVSAGDSIESVMTLSSGALTFTLSDLTTHQGATATVPAPHFHPNGAVCMVNVFGNLAKFSPFNQTCEPTIGGVTAGIGDFPSPNVTARLIIVNSTGAVQASPSGLSADGATFTMAWHSSQALQGVFSPGQQPIFPGSHLAGYLLLNKGHGPVRSVSDIYRQPSASCSAGEPYENATGHYPNDQIAYVGPGLYAGATNLSSYQFFQVGTEAYCQLFFAQPVYIPYFLTEVVTPSDPGGDMAIFAVSGLVVHPGDVIHAQLNINAGSVAFSLTDATTGTTVTSSVPMTGFHPNGVACAMEPIFNIANFTTIDQSCHATIGGTTAGIGDFSPVDPLVSFDLHNLANSTVIGAHTSGLSADGASFSVTWVTSDPFGF